MESTGEDGTLPLAQPLAGNDREGFSIGKIIVAYRTTLTRFQPRYSSTFVAINPLLATANAAVWFHFAAANLPARFID